MRSPDEISAKVKALRDEKETRLMPENLEAKGVAGRMIIDFASAVAVGVGIGYWLDKQFDSSPLLLFIFLIFGMLGGFLNMIKTFNRTQE